MHTTYSWVFHLVAQAMHSWTDSSALDPSHTDQPYFFCEPTGKIQLATSAYTSIIVLSHHSLASPLLHFHLLSWDGQWDFFPAYPPMPLPVSSALAMQPHPKLHTCVSLVKLALGHPVHRDWGWLPPISAKMSYFSNYLNLPLYTSIQPMSKNWQWLYSLLIIIYFFIELHQCY